MGLFNSADYNTLNFLKQELEYVNIHANKYQRLQRKNVKDYLHLRIQELEVHQKPKYWTLNKNLTPKMKKIYTYIYVDF